MQKRYIQTFLCTVLQGGTARGPEHCTLKHKHKRPQSATKHQHQQVRHSVTAPSEICRKIKSGHELQCVSVNEGVTQNTSREHQGIRPRGMERGCSGCAVGINVQGQSLAFRIGFPCVSNALFFHDVASPFHCFFNYH